MGAYHHAYNKIFQDAYEQRVPNYDSLYVRETEHGDCLYGMNYSSHLWKNRNYPEHRIGLMPVGWKIIFDRLVSEAKAESVKKTTAKKDTAADYQQWVDSLPSQFDKEIFIDKNQNAFVDGIGNYLLRLPSSPVDDLKAFFQNNFEIPE